MDQELILRYLVFVGIKEPNDDVVIKNTLSELRWHQDDIEIAISILRGGEIIRDRNSYRSFNPNRTNPTLHPQPETCLLYTSPSPRDRTRSRMPSSA